MTTETNAPTDFALAIAATNVAALGRDIDRERARIASVLPGPFELVPAGKRLVPTGRITACCGSHRRTGSCCDLHDCGPCCPECPSCPTLRRERGETYQPYRRLRIPGHPLATGERCAVYVHRLVLWETLGGRDAVCSWCERPVWWFARGRDRLIADHLDGDTLNNHPTNVVPSCLPCNQVRVRNPRFRTHCSFGHERTDANTYVTPAGARQCKPCRRERDHVRYWLARGVPVDTDHAVTAPVRDIEPFE